MLVSSRTSRRDWNYGARGLGGAIERCIGFILYLYLCRGLAKVVKSNKIIISE